MRKVSIDESFVGLFKGTVSVDVEVRAIQGVRLTWNGASWDIGYRRCSQWRTVSWPYCRAIRIRPWTSQDNASRTPARRAPESWMIFLRCSNTIRKRPRQHTQNKTRRASTWPRGVYFVNEDANRRKMRKVRCWAILFVRNESNKPLQLIIRTEKSEKIHQRLVVVSCGKTSKSDCRVRLGLVWSGA